MKVWITSTVKIKEKLWYTKFQLQCIEIIWNKTLNKTCLKSWNILPVMDYFICLHTCHEI